MLEALANWLIGSDLSEFAGNRIWAIAVSQTFHILAVAVVMIAVASLNLRLLRVVSSGQSFAAMYASYKPWIWWSMLLLLVTGLFQIVAEPAREILSPVFQTKVVLLLCVVGITYTYQKMLRTDPNYWDGPAHRVLAVTLASLSLIFWIGIVVTGRLIAYMGADSALF